MRYPCMLLFTVITAAICFVHYIAHDYEPVYIMFYGLSIPAWFYPLFDYTDVNPVLLYTLTILTWALVGYAVDRFSVLRKASH